MSKDGVYVMMPVRCIGKICKNCPNLNVDSDVHELFGNGEYLGAEVNLYCRGVRRCSRIKDMVENDFEKQFDMKIEVQVEEDDDERT